MTIKIISARWGCAAWGFTMAMFTMAAVGFVGIAIAMLQSGRDLEFNNRQTYNVYRARWA